MNETARIKPRPRWYNLNPLNLPAPGMVSILHRASGGLLFLGLIWFLFLLDASLSSEEGFERMRGYVALPAVKAALLVFLWALMHHFCAGIRYLLLDLDLGMEIGTARATGYVVIALGLVLTVVIGAMLW